MYRVVIVDDVAEFLVSLGHLCNESQDFQVLGMASTGREALRLVDQIRPDLVIADLEMPDLDGLELARQLHHQQPEIKVILVSVHTDQEYETIAREEGALAFIPKEHLSLEALRQALGQREG